MNLVLCEDIYREVTMITPYLSPINSATPEEIELYYKVEESMVLSGELGITKKELYQDIDGHQSIYFLKNHDHFHYFSLIAAIAVGSLAYHNYIHSGAFDFQTAGLITASLSLLVMTWIVYHPKLKYESHAREFFKTHRRLFLFKD